MSSYVPNDQVPYFIISHERPLLLSSSVFGCTCFAHDLTPGKDKLSVKNLKCISFITPTFRWVIIVFVLNSNNIIFAKVTFFRLLSSPFLLY